MSTPSPSIESSHEFKRELAYDILSFLISLRVDAVEQEEANSAPDHKKIANLMEEAEFYTQEQDAVIRDDDAAISRVMNKHYPPIKEAYDRHRFAAITPEERRRRQEAFDYACASVELEGGHISEDYKRHAARYINGEIDAVSFMILN